MAFLGSTIGNLSQSQRPDFFDSVASMLDKDDGFLLGIDLIKDESTLVAAYSDSAGISSAFNKNVLTVLNRELEGDFVLDAFEQVTEINTTTGCMEQSLRANRDIVARLETIDLEIRMEDGETIHIEWSCKFTRDQITRELAVSGLRVTNWWTDTQDRYALVLARKPSTPSS